MDIVVALPLGVSEEPGCDNGGNKVEHWGKAQVSAWKRSKHEEGDIPTNANKIQASLHLFE
jgi:hypothetical protein